jgi:ribosomal protein L11 methyltransferase
MTPPLWILRIELPKSAGAVFADALADLADNLSCFESDGGRRWRLEALFAAAPDRAALEARLALAAAASGSALPALAILRLPARDWLADNRKQFPPVRAGRFFLVGSFHEGLVPPGVVAIQLDAGLAFGSGTHGSTRGCLLALDRLARRRRFRRALDLGCGSGILAIAMAKRWRGRVVAADIDPVAVRVARANAARNGVKGQIQAVVSAGLEARLVLQARPYDLIVANILARPLRAMAAGLARALAPRGVLVLSGITASQTGGLLSAYRTQGLRLAGQLRLGDWATLIMAKTGAAGR